MSVAATSLVKRHRFGSVERKAIVLVIADYCDEEWSCFPSQGRIAAEAEVGDRTVRRHLASLEHENLIARERRSDRLGHRTSDRIWLVPAAIEALPLVVLPVTVAGGGEAAYRPATTPLPATGDSPTGQGLADESLEEPPVEPLARVATSAHFTAWWSLYPRKVGKRDAERAFAKAIKDGATVELLDQAARNTALRPSEFQPHPTTLLRNERWRDWTDDGEETRRLLARNGRTVDTDGLSLDAMGGMLAERRARR